MIKKGLLKFGDIVIANFEPSTGHEYQKIRPAVVIQSNDQIKKSNLVTIIPLTTNLGGCTDDDILITADQTNNLVGDSVAKVHCITSFDYSRFEKKIGAIDERSKKAIKEYIKIHFEI